VHDFSTLQRECCCALPTSDFSARFVGSRHCAAAFFLQVPKSCKDLDTSLLYTLILETYSKLIRKNKMLMLGVCFPQPWPSRALATGTLRRDHVWITADNLFHFHKTNSMKCFVNWIPLNTHVRFNWTQPYLKRGLGISRINADSQWNPFYNTFHRFFCCGNETIRW